MVESVPGYASDYWNAFIRPSVDTSLSSLTFGDDSGAQQFSMTMFAEITLDTNFGSRMIQSLRAECHMAS